MWRGTLTMVFLSSATLWAGSQPDSAEESLRAVHEAYYRAWNERDAAGVVANQHPEALGFGDYEVIPSDLTGMDESTRRGRIEAVFGNWEQQSITPRYAVYRVFADTGIVAEIVQVSSKVRGGAPRLTSFRRTTVYVHSDDGWKRVSWHVSPVNSGLQ